LKFFVTGKTYPIQSDTDLKHSTDVWFRAFAKAVSQISKNNKRIKLIVPPNKQIFIKHLPILEVKKKVSKKYLDSNVAIIVQGNW
jgi:hypothetical protein